uniref:Uncharacterized protein n=1 Tax=Arundo donax TaxID=35708 RepID=A0A0A9HFP8_ARUDO
MAGPYRKLLLRRTTLAAPSL